MPRVRELIDRHVTARRILFGGWMVFLAYCYPGFMSFDSGVQLEQARGLTPMSNWHPPVMALLWRLCDHIIAGPFLMLVIQSVTLLLGMYFILRRTMSDRAAAIASVLILISPPVITTMGVIWKDSQMAGFLMLGTAMLVKRTRAALIAGCVLIWLGTAQRHNAAAATLPIMVLLFVWNEGHTRWKRYGIATAVWLAITVSAGMATSALADKKEDVFASLALNDICGVINFEPGYTDDDIRAEAPGLPWLFTDGLVRRTKAVYSPVMTWLDLTVEPTKIFTYPTTPAESAAVSAAWRNLILKHPRAYLRHRWKVFLAELRVIRRTNFYFWPAFADSAERAQKLSTMETYSWLQVAWRDMLIKLAFTPVFWAWVYFLIGIPLIWLLRKDIVALAVVLSGLACESGLLLVGPAIDYRYSHWLVTCSILAAVYYNAMRLRSRAAAR